MTTATMTITGTEAGADYVLVTCEHGRTGEAIDPPDSGIVLTDTMDRVQTAHRRDTGCDCDKLLAVLDGTERLIH